MLTCYGCTNINYGNNNNDIKRARCSNDVAKLSISLQVTLLISTNCTPLIYQSSLQLEQRMILLGG